MTAGERIRFQIHRNMRNCTHLAMDLQLLQSRHVCLFACSALLAVVAVFDVADPPNTMRRHDVTRLEHRGWFERSLGSPGEIMQTSTKLPRGTTMPLRESRAPGWILRQLTVSALLTAGHHAARPLPR